MEWIKIEDRFPENRHWCLVMANNELFLACYKHGIFETEKPIILNQVTHWMPLPDAPAKPKLVWQRSTKAMPDIWITSTDDEYEVGKHLTKFNWRQKEI